jgi:hypothetical protein
MAVLAIHEMWSGNASDATLSDNFRKLDVNMQKRFQVVVDVGTPIEEVYQANVGGVRLPGIAEPFSAVFPYVFAKSVKPQQVSPIMYLVDAMYSGECGSDPTDSPLNKPTSVSWSDSATMEEIDRDFNGLPNVNANGELIKGIRIELVDDVLTLKRNFATFNPYIRGMYRRSVNSDTFYGWPPGTGKIKQFDANNVLDDTIGYWQVTLKVQFRYPINTTAERAWWHRSVHQGMYVRRTAGTEPTRAVDLVTKDLMTKPVLLKEDGTRETNPENAFFIEKQLYGTLPFNALGF